MMAGAKISKGEGGGSNERAGGEREGERIGAEESQVDIQSIREKERALELKKASYCRYREWTEN